LTKEQADLVRQARAHLALYADMADMIRLGAYKQGTDALVDAAMRVVPRLEAFMTQSRDEPTSLPECFERLTKALNG
jgi:flagellum-specific ATP synthase